MPAVKKGVYTAYMHGVDHEPRLAREVMQLDVALRRPPLGPLESSGPAISLA